LLCWATSAFPSGTAAISPAGAGERCSCVSVPTVVGCAGALLIVVAAIATPIARTQKMRELWFYGMSGGAVLKIATMEIARLVL